MQNFPYLANCIAHISATTYLIFLSFDIRDVFPRVTAVCQYFYCKDMCSDQAAEVQFCIGMAP